VLKVYVADYRSLFFTIDSRYHWTDCADFETFSQTSYPSYLIQANMANIK